MTMVRNENHGNRHEEYLGQAHQYTQYSWGWTWR